MPGLFTVGETMASLRAAGPIRLGGDLRLSIAGAESNVAIGVARLGWPAAWVGVVGDDGPGALIMRTLRAEGVATVGSRVEPSAPTGMMIVEPRLADLSQVTYFRVGSAASSLSAGDTLAGFSAHRPDIVHVTGITAALGTEPHRAVHELMAAASRAGIPVCFDVNYRSALWPREAARKMIAPLAAVASIVVASEEELALAGAEGDTTDDAALVGALLAGGVEEVIVTRGARGASAYNADGIIDQPALSVTVVDTVGAGDAFVAGYLSVWLEGGGTSERLERAARTAAFAVSSRGDWEGLPTLAELVLLDMPGGGSLR